VPAYLNNNNKSAISLFEDDDDDTGGPFGAKKREGKFNNLLASGVGNQ